jgi:hypothetical protein
MEIYTKMGKNMDDDENENLDGVRSLEFEDHKKLTCCLLVYLNKFSNDFFLGALTNC